MLQNAHLLRLVPLAAAALASVATSAAHVEMNVKSVLPPPGETGVAADAVITLQVEVVAANGADIPADIGLRTASGTKVPGKSEHTVETGGRRYRFTPDAPLPPDRYVVFWVESPWTGTSYEDDRLAEAFWAIPRGQADDGSLITGFSTIDAPAVRTSRLTTATNVFNLSFTQDLDVDSLTNVKIVDAAGAEVDVVRTWRGGDLHELDLAAAPGGVDVVLQPGLKAKTGTPFAGLPVTIEPTRYP